MTGISIAAAIASTQLTMVKILYFLSLAQMWNLLAGYAGLVSVGRDDESGARGLGVKVRRTKLVVWAFV